MRRKQRYEPDRISQTWERVNTLKGTHFDELAKWLHSFMETASLPEYSQNRYSIIGYVSSITDKLPPLQSRRFLFDAYLLQTIKKSWGLKSSSATMLIPTYGFSWGHQYFQLHPQRYISFVHIYDESDNNFPELLEYPWMIHELGHYILKFEGKPLLEAYRDIVNHELLQFRLRAGADQGTAKIIAQRKIESYTQYWSSDSMWPREIMSDTIALWCCGPAYLATYLEEHRTREPFLTTPDHPPVELRTKALLYAAAKLDWKNHLDMLSKLWDDWDRDRLSTPEVYRNYNATRHLELMEACVECTINFCKQLSLPRLTTSDLNRLEQIVRGNVEIDEGIDLIVAARIAHKAFNDDAYERWITYQFELIA